MPTWKHTGGLLFLLGPVLSGCSDRLPDGVGSSHEIVVLCDDRDWEIFESVLRETFERIVRTPQPEKVFAVKHRGPDRFETYRIWRNLLLLAPLESDGETAAWIRSLLSSEARAKVENGEAYVFVRTDIWATKQTVTILSARNAGELRTRIEGNREDLFRTMEEHLDRKVTALLYSRGEEVELAQDLAGRYGWTLRIPEGYGIYREQPEAGYVWLRRPEPERWLFVYWEPLSGSADPSPSRCRIRRDEICARFRGGDRVLPEDLRMEAVTFAGRPAHKLSGLWENEEREVGGPFRSYCFADSASARLFLIDLAMFAPEARKEPYLRQLDLIAQTFRSAE